MKLTKSKLKQIIKEELQEGFLDKFRKSAASESIDNLKAAAMAPLGALLDYEIVHGTTEDGPETEPALAKQAMLKMIEELIDQALKERTFLGMHGHILQTPAQTKEQEKSHASGGPKPRGRV